MYAVIFHAHQKLDRVAHRHLRRIVPAGTFFPAITQILHFEGGHGPDTAKLKRQQHNAQPWHFVDPFDITDTQLHEQVTMHYQGLVRALIGGDDIRAAFEAAWLAHALVDGLTPAHHYPYEAELTRLRGGGRRDDRKGLLGRAFVQSNTVRESVLASLKLVGPGGLLTTHAMFEGGAYAIIAPLRLTSALPTRAELDRVCQEGIVAVFQQTAQEVAGFHLYDRFIAGGWTVGLNHDVRIELAPRMVRIITLAWYAASREAGQVKGTVKT